MRRVILALVLAAAISLPTLRPTAAQEGVDIIRASEQGLAAAIRNKDRRALGTFIAAKFSWTDATGTTRPKSEVMHNVGLLAPPGQDETDVKTYFYGAVATVLGTRKDARFVRIWVKRQLGWLLLIAMETPIAKEAPARASVEAAAGEGDCDNPCRTVPFRPKTDIDKTILAAWQKTKTLEWKPNADEWASYIADEFMIINNTTVRNREQRIAIAKKQQEAGVGAPGDPVTFMRINDFPPSAAVMVSRHVPYRGGKPYINLRVWVLRDNRWQLALSQQVANLSAPDVPAVVAKK
jgi:Domain of unknown function (DUF4440)